MIYVLSWKQIREYFILCRREFNIILVYFTYVAESNRILVYIIAKMLLFLSSERQDNIGHSRRHFFHLEIATQQKWVKEQYEGIKLDVHEINDLISERYFPTKKQNTTLLGKSTYRFFCEKTDSRLTSVSFYEPHLPMHSIC